MADAYRDHAYRCPTCGNAALRAHAARLVCDECGGMLLTSADLEAELRALDGSLATVGLARAAAAEPTCPRCAGPLARARVAFGKAKLPGDALACARDGVWLTADQMVELLARVSRHASPIGRAGGYAASGIGAAGGTGSMSSALAGISSAFGGGLAVSRRPAAGPSVHTPFVSAYAGRALRCPACADAALAWRGQRWACAACDGAFVEDAALVAMVGEMLAGPWELPPVAGAASAVPCPVCAAPLTASPIADVPVARCAAHGTWCASGDLGRVLQAAGAPPAPRKGLLGKLFGR